MVRERHRRAPEIAWMSMLLLLKVLATVDSIACTERVPTTPTGPGTTPTTSSANCTYEISPTSRIHGPSAEIGTISVSTASGCAWTANSGVSWIRITSGASGTGSGAVGYAVDANTAGGRTGTVNVAGRDFAVEQARPACVLDEIADVSRWFVAGGTNGTARASGTRVEIRLAIGQRYAGLISPCPLRGDFDVQVDYALINLPTGSGGLGTNPRLVGLNRNSQDRAYHLYVGSSMVIGRVATTDTSGQLRLARTGASIAGFYSNGGEWRSLGTGSGGDPVRFYLELGVPAPVTESELVMMFQNFRINVGTPAN